MTPELFNQNANYSDETSEKTVTQGFDDFGVLNMVVIAENSKIVRMMTFLEIVVSLFTSYYYGYLAAFYEPEDYFVTQKFEIAIELFFMISMFRKMFTEFVPDGHTMAEKRVSKITKHYLGTDFTNDLVPLLPITLISLHYDKYFRLFYLLKIARIQTLKKVQFQQGIMISYKNFRLSRITQKIREDHTIGDDIYQDHNNIEYIILLQYTIKTARLILILSTVSYFTGILWYISCDLVSKYLKNDWSKHGHFDSSKYNMNLFVDFYDVSPILLTYFSFTTLSTVGFGDIHPKSDVERILAIIMLLVGVACFSSIMNVFITILDQFTIIN